MKRRISMILVVTASVSLALTGCGSSATEEDTSAQEISVTQEEEADAEEQTEAEDDVEEAESIEDYEYYNALYDGTGFVYSTSDILDYKKSECDQQGTVVSLEYETPAYAVNAVLGTDYVITKKVNIYLPYGYDESQEYNIVYLMHGGGDDEDYWLTTGSDRVHGETTGKVLDNMIKDGLCDPVIIVSPTFYSDVEGVEVTDDECAALIEELGEDNYSSIEDLYTWYFQYELRNEIIPLVESEYSTYADGDVSEENLIATRDHRAYAGLSMGSLTSMHSILMGNLDYISYIGSFSGAKTNKDLFVATLEEKYADYSVNFWYNGNGVEDQAFEEHYQFYQDVTAEMSDKFVDGENAAMVVLEDGGHNYAAWIADLYNSLLVFFK